ncbi:MAG: hypothetical protein J7J20_05925 [Desulfurococcales archaeon]|nr:hypothetical protein [Desulfurococcales archaeon]
MRAIVKIDPKGRITIPLYIRESVGLEPFSYAEVEVGSDGKSIVIKPISRSGEVLIDFKVSLSNINDFMKVLKTLLAEGVEVRLLKCRSSADNEYDCVLTLTLLDRSLAEHLENKLKCEGIKAEIL